MSKFKKGDNALFVTPHGLIPVRVISTTGENLQPHYRDKYPIAAVSSQGDVYNFTPEGRMLVTDALPRLFPIPPDVAPEPTPEVELPSFIVSEVINDLLRREEVGLKKYGTTVDRGDLSRKQWMQHFYEELLDGAVYARKFLQDMPE